MNIEITSRSPEIPEALRAYSQDRLAGIERLGEEFEKGEIILDVEHDEILCEVILHRHRGEPFVAHARAKEGRAAVDSTAVRLERQFLRFKEMHGHKGKRQRAS